MASIDRRRRSTAGAADGSVATVGVDTAPQPGDSATQRGERWRRLGSRLIDGLLLTVIAGVLVAAVRGGEVPILFESARVEAWDGEPYNRFGTAVAIDGETLAVGAPWQGPSGAVYVFRRVAGGSWEDLAKLESTQARPGDGFGTALAGSGTALVVGAPWHEEKEGLGAIHIFETGGGEGWTEVAVFDASGGNGGSELGSSVALDGDTVVAGAPWYRAGVGLAYVFERDPLRSWRRSQTLAVSGLLTSAFFGNSVAVHENTAVVGADGDRVGGIRSGAAYVFEKSEGGMPEWVRKAKLEPPVPEDWLLFGESIAVFGDWIAVGAPNRAKGGSVYLYGRAGDDWQLVARLDSPDPESEAFGWKVALERNRLLVGADGDDQQAEQAGAAFLFEWVQTADGVEWQPTRKLLASDGGGHDHLGLEVAMAGGSMALSSRVWTEAVDTVYIFSEDLFADGFESGDTSAWSTTVP